jgi:NAD(P)-dependent dehydrogenase (short-subunit alcohol dehydrogenase family)
MSQDYADIFDMGGRTVVVTGAANGLGREIAFALVDFGAAVVLADVDRKGLDAVAAAIADAGGRAIAVETDVSSEAQVDAMIERALTLTGHLDGLAHCAGIGGRAPAESYPMDLWDRIFAVNVDGTFLCLRAAGRVMIAQGGGSIVNLSSVGGIVGKPGSVAYQVGKAIEVQIVKSLGVEWGGTGVRVNTIAPGAFLTDTIRAELAREPTMNDQLLKNLPLKREGELKEIVGAAIYLLSDAGSYVTGTVLPVDGGILAA